LFEGSSIKDPDGNDIALWDHKLAGEMQKVEEIFAYVVSENSLIASNGRILNPAVNVAKEYTDGLPALLRFLLSAESTSFSLEFPVGSVTQDITEALSNP
jgi:hypothetical protein